MRALAGQMREPARLIDALQETWDLLGFDRIATAIWARLEVTSGELIVASAGHPPPLVVADGHARFLPVTATTPLGSIPVPATDWRGTLSAGETLLLFTDGLTEDRHIGIAEGMARLARLAGDGPGDPNQLCDRILGALSADRHDDIAVLAISRG
jgi:serine/threonine-protein kinase RsbW